MSVASLIRALQEHQDTLGALTDARAAQLSSILHALEKRILGAVAKGSGAVTDASLVDLTANVNRLIRNSGAEAWIGGSVRDSAIQGFRMQAASVMSQLNVTSWDAVSVPQVRQAFLTFERRTLGALINSTSEKSFRAQWAAQLRTKAMDPIRQGLGSRLSTAQLTGETWEDVSRSLIDDVGNLNLVKNTPEQVAKTFTKTAMTDVFNDVAVGSARAAGLDRFENILGAADQHTPICLFASQQPPLTLSEWNALEFEGTPVGMPSRHFGCGSFMAAAVPAAKDIDWEEVQAETMETA